MKAAFTLQLKPLCPAIPLYACYSKFSSLSEERRGFTGRGQCEMAVTAKVVSFLFLARCSLVGAFS